MQGFVGIEAGGPRGVLVKETALALGGVPHASPVSRFVSEQVFGGRGEGIAHGRIYRGRVGAGRSCRSAGARGLGVAEGGRGTGTGGLGVAEGGRGAGARGLGAAKGVFGTGTRGLGAVEGGRGTGNLVATRSVSFGPPSFFFIPLSAPQELGQECRMCTCSRRNKRAVHHKLFAYLFVYVGEVARIDLVFRVPVLGLACEQIDEACASHS